MDYSSFCAFCGIGGNLLRCSGCKRTYYCTKHHQKQDWRRHKRPCKALQSSSQNISSEGLNVNVHDVTSIIQNSNILVGDSYSNQYNSQFMGMSNGNCNISPIIFQGSSESEIISAETEELDHILEYIQSEMNNSPSSVNVATPLQNQLLLSNDVSVEYSDEHLFSLEKGVPVSSVSLETRLGDIDNICSTVIKDMGAYGVCAVDNFLGYEKGQAVLKEVVGMHGSGVFKDGQLVSNKAKKDLKTIRGDQITWVDGKEINCQNIGGLIRKVDEVIMRANTMINNDKMGDYTINGRTKAMVACYPGHGTHYVKHVDNPNRDGRCITAIYYLNLNWDVQQNGGLLRIFPEGTDQVADIVPTFDRILFFWSDRRNPHEVQPAFKTRYAITLWYFDKKERDEATERYKLESTFCGSLSTHKNPPLVTNCS